MGKSEFLLRRLNILETTVSVPDFLSYIKPGDKQQPNSSLRLSLPFMISTHRSCMHVILLIIRKKIKGKI